jgi:hypothetical protein
MQQFREPRRRARMWTYEIIDLTGSGSAIPTFVDPSERLNEIDSSGNDIEILMHVPVKLGYGRLLIRHTGR